MIKRLLPILLLLVCICSCKKKNERFSNNGSYEYKGQTYTIRSARQHFFVDSVSSKTCIDLAFCTGKMSYTDGKQSGTGTLLVLTVESDTSHLAVGNFALTSNSYLLTISDDKKDTVKSRIDSGTLEVATSEHGYKFAFSLSAASSALKGNYEGTTAYYYDVDGEALGEIVINDTIVIPLQRGNLLRWGNLFAEGLNYHEFYLYSCDLRYSDAGKIKRGYVFVLGVHSSSNDVLPLGTYPLSRSIEDQTLYYGHRVGSASWGTYWQEIKSLNAQTKSNVISGDIRFSPGDGGYNISIKLQDQLENNIVGNYWGDFKEVNAQ